MTRCAWIDETMHVWIAAPDRRTDVTTEAVDAGRAALVRMGAPGADGALLVTAVWSPDGPRRRWWRRDRRAGTWHHELTPSP